MSKRSIPCSVDVVGIVGTFSFQFWNLIKQYLDFFLEKELLDEEKKMKKIVISLLLKLQSSSNI